MVAHSHILKTEDVKYGYLRNAIETFIHLQKFIVLFLIVLWNRFVGKILSSLK